MPERVQPQNPASISKKGYLSVLEREVREERETDYENSKNGILEKSTNELKYSDTSFIPGVEVLRSLTKPGKIVKVQVPDDHIDSNTVNIRDEYGFFCDNEVVIQGELKGQKIKAFGRIVAIDDPVIKVELSSGSSSVSNLKQQLPPANNVTIANILNHIPYDRKLEAIQLAKDHPIRGYLVGDDPVRFSNKQVTTTRRFDKPLYSNEQQAEGIKKALRADRLACLQGPPGTGKTRVIIELVRRITSANKRVLVAAETNAAVDNILIGSSEFESTDERSLLYHHERGKLRAARTNPDREGIHPLARDRFKDSSLRRADVVASTNSSASEIPNSQTFDYVIIDEATQASIPSSLIPTVYGQTTILVGDHKQLPPFSHQNAIQKSLFERLYAEDGIYGPRIGIRFNTQYRMHERIAGFSSEEFYDEGLKTASEAGKVSKNIDVYPVGIFDVSGHNEIGNKPKKNPAEIECVKMQLKMLIENKGIRGSDIGVAAAYKKQANEIESHLQQSEIQDVSSVKVNTFDSFQGSERDAMILSFTRSNENGNIGFLGDEIGKRRLNVALTRAKRYCALIGDWETLRDGSELYDRLYQYVTSEVPPKKVKT